MFKALTKVVMSIKPKICLLMGKKNVKRHQDTMFSDCICITRLDWIDCNMHWVVL